MLQKWLLTLVLLSAITLSAQGFQVVITELMPDPDPAPGLPPEEFIELTNVSGKTINISGWQLSNGRTKARFPDSLHLASDSILIVCASRNADLFKVYGMTLGIDRFPAINNAGDTIILYNDQGDIVHAVPYHPGLYGDQSTSGRSLEMMDTRKSCSLQNNWAPSIAPEGGTPGRPNSRQGESQLDQHFTLLHSYCASDSIITLVFDDRINTSSAIHPAAIQAIPAQQFSSIKVSGVLGNQLDCHLITPLQPGQVLEIGADGISSCLSDAVGGILRVKSGLADTDAIHLVINEILFDPPPGGSDYVELLNTSGKVIDLQRLAFASRNNTGAITIPKHLVTEPRYFYPGEYLVFTQDPGWLGKQFLVKDPAGIISVAVLPSWPNESGTVVVIDTSGIIIDELKYSADWHFPLLRSSEGVSLERKNPAAKTQDPTNWFSAAMTAGYGTPGYANSQMATMPAPGNKVEFIPALFSPNGDGRDDVSQLRYKFDQAGFMLTAKIYNRDGSLVRTLVNNGLCGMEGSYAWDGRDDKKNQLPANIYIVVTDIFSLDGKVRKFKTAVTLGY